MSNYPFGPAVQVDEIVVDDYLEEEFENDEERDKAWDRFAELTERFNAGRVLSPTAANEFWALRGIFGIEIEGE